MECNTFCNTFMNYLNEVKSIKNNGMKIVKLEEGYAEIEMIIQEIHLNLFDSLHGGYYYLLADTAAGAATMANGISNVTLNGSVTYIKPVSSGKVKAIAREVSRTRKISLCEVIVRDENEQILTRCTFTLYITGKDLSELVTHETCST